MTSITQIDYVHLPTKKGKQILSVAEVTAEVQF
jgi:hypothetical protein